MLAKSQIKVGRRYRLANSDVTVTFHQPERLTSDGWVAAEGFVDVVYDDGDTDRVEERTFRQCSSELA